jgi:hypothetical protein
VLLWSFSYLVCRCLLKFELLRRRSEAVGVVYSDSQIRGLTGKSDRRRLSLPTAVGARTRRREAARA